MFTGLMLTRLRIATRVVGSLAAVGLAAATVQAGSYPEPLPVETMLNVTTLPPVYPDSWIYVHDLNPASLIDGRAAIVDVAADSRAYIGQVPIAYLGNILPGSVRPEIYVAETFHSRLTRGERTDAITIWDKASLQPKGEIVLPGAKRGLIAASLKNAFQFTNGEKWGLVFNFTPATSVTVVDLEGRRILSEIDLPGCSLAYPAGERGFATLCADGTMTSIALGPDGEPASTATSKPFNDIDADPMFMGPAHVGETAWFATFNGRIRGIDLSGAVAQDLGAFELPRTKTPEGEWRPSGGQVIAADRAGRLYVLMNPAGKEGSHKDGGTEVWIADPGQKRRVGRIVLTSRAVSIEVTAQDQPLLAAARPDGTLDVYDVNSGELRRTIPEVVMAPVGMGVFQ